MKAFTDIQQSKKLAEILPPDSADMSYTWDFDDEQYYISTEKFSNWIVPKYAESEKHKQVIPCWSIAALLDVLHHNLKLVLAINDYQGDRKEKYVIGSIEHDKYDCFADNPIDACYEMIIKLHEQKLL